jgi:glycosyltransferase involved in cell wall biosynthesis
MWHRCDPEERQDIYVLNVGPPSPIPFHETQGFKVLGTGYVKNRQHMAKLYKLSDIALCTTISDAGPMMVSESMRNECPVIAFDRSVALDIVTSGINGYIIKNLDTVEMADRALELLRDPNLEEISKKCPAGVEQHHNFERITQKWDSIINELIKDYDLNASRNS